VWLALLHRVERTQISVGEGVLTEARAYQWWLCPLATAVPSTFPHHLSGTSFQFSVVQATKQQPGLSCAVLNLRTICNWTFSRCLVVLNCWIHASAVFLPLKQTSCLSSWWLNAFFFLAVPATYITTLECMVLPCCSFHWPQSLSLSKKEWLDNRKLMLFQNTYSLHVPGNTSKTALFLFCLPQESDSTVKVSSQVWHCKTHSQLHHTAM
jgi:hypothetical protein